MIRLLLELAALVFLALYLLPLLTTRQVKTNHHARVATLTKTQAIRVPRAKNGVGANHHSGTYYASNHTPSGGTEQVQQ